MDNSLRMYSGGPGPASGGGSLSARGTGNASGGSAPLAMPTIPADSLVIQGRPSGVDATSSANAGAAAKPPEESLAKNGLKKIALGLGLGLGGYGLALIGAPLLMSNPVTAGILGLGALAMYTGSAVAGGWGLVNLARSAFGGGKEAGEQHSS